MNDTRSRPATKTLCGRAEHGKSHPAWPMWALTPEKVLQAAVEATAQSCGWLYHHTWNSQHSAAGFPDLVLVRGGRLVFAELKTVDGKESAAQWKWLRELVAVGHDVGVYTWRPCDRDEIEEVLR